MAHLTDSDLSLLKQRGITPDQLESQLNRYASGFPFLRIADTARVGHGIMALSPEQTQAAASTWERYIAEQDGDCIKFVPASGAASRMFKAVHSFVSSDSDDYTGNPAIAEIISRVAELPFYDELDQTCRRLYGDGVSQLIAEGRNRDLLRAVVDASGMNYGNMPKGLLTFHRYAFGVRTAVEEQLVEASKYVATNGLAKLHLTVSAEHVELFRDTLSRVIGPMEELTDTRFDVSLSVQKPSTDTVAANPDGTPFRNSDGSLLFRPGGHGSLIENLNDIKEAVVFIKNIDNIASESLTADTITYKKALGGILLQVRDRIHKYLNKLTRGHGNEDLHREVIEFMRNTLCIEDPRYETLKGRKLEEFLISKLNRPIRVCGMVRNEGEPGGGPYLTFGADGSVQPQILESTQIDMSNKHYVELMKTATHFNPVDLVCYIRDVNGKKFNLPDYVDPDTGFIAEKSAKGRDLLAMERPGLWNGAMSDWNTLFVEVPVSTFNPVKTLNDLLRPTHCVKE